MVWGKCREVGSEEEEVFLLLLLVLQSQLRHPLLSLVAEEDRGHARPLFFTLLLIVKEIAYRQKLNSLQTV